MKEPFSEETLEHAYDAFSRKHDGHRQELLERISKVEATLSHGSFQKKRRHLAGMVLSLAAMLLFGVTLGVLFWPSATSPAAAAVERAREHLLAVQSLHLKGWIYQTIQEDGRPVVERFPYEFYAERPHRFWKNAYGFSFGEHGALESVTHVHSASDGEQTIWVSHDQRLARIAPAHRLQSQLETERYLQAKVFDRLVAGLPETYRRVGAEKFQDVLCHVYEQYENSQEGFGHRRRLWLNAGNGAPVRTKAWVIRPSGIEEPLYEYDMIEINGPRPRNLFSFEAPEGYQAVRVGAGTELLEPPDGAVASGGGLRLGVWIPFNVEDRAVLLCWWVDVPIEDDRRQWTPSFALGPPGSERACGHVDLHKGARWNWSLLLPNEDQPRIGVDDRISVVLKGEHAHLQAVERPLRLPREILAKVLLEAQRSTIPPESDVEPFTLEDVVTRARRPNTANDSARNEN